MQNKTNKINSNNLFNKKEELYRKQEKLNRLRKKRTSKWDREYEKYLQNLPTTIEGGYNG